MRLTGGPAPAFTGTTIDGETVRLADFRGRKLWLVLSRYAACPFCSLRIHALIHDHAEVVAAGVTLVVVFPSPPERISRYVLKYNPRFTILSDAAQELYRAYASERSVVGELRSATRLGKVVKAMALGNNLLHVDGPIHRMPAEFLINEEGRIDAAHYGRELDDGFTLEAVLEWARATR